MIVVSSHLAICTMKVLAVFCLVVAVAQAYEVDWWRNLISLDVEPAQLQELVAQSKQEIPSRISRITNGQEAEIGQFPYQVGLLIETARGTGFCGGSILSNEWILTAAHCVDSAVGIEVIIGAHNIVDREPDQIRIRTSDIIWHERYTRLYVKNDIAVVKLSEKIEFNELIQPVRLASRSQVRESFARQTGIVSGWGLTSDSETHISTTLQWTDSSIATNGYCTPYYFGLIIRSQICLRADGGRSSCSGDSGGPLVIVDTDGQRTQVGIVSHGIAFGCESGWPGVYTRVTSYLDWIAAKTGVDV